MTIRQGEKISIYFEEFRLSEWWTKRNIYFSAINVVLLLLIIRIFIFFTIRLCLGIPHFNITIILVGCFVFLYYIHISFYYQYFVFFLSYLFITYYIHIIFALTIFDSFCCNFFVFHAYDELFSSLLNPWWS